MAGVEDNDKPGRPGGLGKARGKSAEEPRLGIAKKGDEGPKRVVTPGSGRAGDNAVKRGAAKSGSKNKSTTKTPQSKTPSPRQRKRIWRRRFMLTMAVFLLLFAALLYWTYWFDRFLPYRYQATAAMPDLLRAEVVLTPQAFGALRPPWPLGLPERASEGATSEDAGENADAQEEGSEAPAEPVPDDTEAAADEALSTEELRELEALLAAMEFNPGTVDGVIDTKARRAIRDYREMAGLPLSEEPSRALLNDLRAVNGLLDDTAN